MSTATRPQQRVPPLRPGDHLTAEEFERRYNAMSDVNKAELIEGVVFMPSPVSIEDHGAPHFDLISWLGYYRVFTPGVQGGDNATLRLLVGENRPQPDAFLRILPEFGGQSQTSEKYVVGSPELNAEVSASTVSFDLHEKLRVYCRNGVNEYIVWRVEDEAIDWFVLRGNQYDLLALSAEGWYKSEVFPGLWLDPVALVQRDMPRVLSVLQQGLASPEHAAFVERLRHAHRS